MKPVKDNQVVADSPIQTGRRARHAPQANDAEVILPWEPACEWKDVMYSKNVGAGRVIQTGERVGYNGNREFILYIPSMGQEVHTYRPFGWFM
jgi:hypothetical protein